MARLLLAGLLAAAAVTPVLAQPAPPAPPVPAIAIPRAPAMMTTMTRAQVQSMVEAQFARRDANRDGVLTAEELTARGLRGERQNVVVRRLGRDGGAPVMGDANAAFDRLDANRDGSISRDEFGQARQVRIEKRVMVNGQPGAAGAPHIRMIRRGGGGMMGAAMLQRADTNRDGRITRAEATGAALQHFDMMDSNRDGRVTPEERAAGRAHMMQMRRAG
jgi:Ca2+-binding EF-hand superfamily protein